MPQSKWAAKQVLWQVMQIIQEIHIQMQFFGLERHIKNYPADKNIPYAHYLIAMCYYEQILDEKKDLQPLLKAKEKFEFIMKTYPEY